MVKTTVTKNVIKMSIPNLKSLTCTLDPSSLKRLNSTPVRSVDFASSLNSKKVSELSDDIDISAKDGGKSS